MRAGVFVDDTLDMIEWLISERSIKNIHLVGHCGGALTALLTASKHKVQGLYLISTPMTPSSETEGSMSSQAADEYYSLYKRKLFSLEAWKNLLTGKSSYKTILNTIKNKFSGPTKKRSCMNDLSGVVDERLIEAFRNIPGTTPITMVIGDKDPGIESFRSFSRLTPKHLNIKTDVFDLTSHGFVTDDSLKKLNNSIRDYATGFANN